jgi:hypothetical protein
VVVALRVDRCVYVRCPAVPVDDETTAAASSEESTPHAPCFRLSVLDPLGLFASLPGAEETSAAAAKPAGTAGAGNAAAAAAAAGTAAVKGEAERSNVRQTEAGPVLKMPADETFT